MAKKEEILLDKQTEQLINHFKENDPEAYLVVTNDGCAGIKGNNLQIMQLYSSITQVLNKEANLPKTFLDAAYEIAFEQDLYDVDDKTLKDKRDKIKEILDLIEEL